LFPNKYDICLAVKIELTTDMDFLCARVRGLRSKLYAGPSLLALARLATSAAYYERVLSGKVPPSHTEGERSLITAHVEHLLRLCGFLAGRRRQAFEWLTRRYQIENLKVLLRARSQKIGAEKIQDLLFELPEELSLPVDEILSAGDTESLARAIPLEAISGGISRAAGLPDDSRLPFFLESAVEKAFLTEGLNRVSKVGHAERARCMNLLAREVVSHNVLFVWRAMKNYSLGAALLRDFLVLHGPFEKSATYLRAFEGDDVAATLQALGMSNVLGGRQAAPATAAGLEAALQAWLYRAARRCYAESLADFGVVVSYYYLKRFELQDLLRLSEALRKGLGPDEAVTHLVTVK